MKKLSYFLSLFLLLSCNEGKNKFIVERISYIDDQPKMVKYQIQTYGIWEFDIIDSVGKFQVGDTLTLVKQ